MYAHIRECYREFVFCAREGSITSWLLCTFYLYTRKSFDVIVKYIKWHKSLNFTSSSLILLCSLLVTDSETKKYTVSEGCLFLLQIARYLAIICGHTLQWQPAFLIYDKYHFRKCTQGNRKRHIS